MQSGPGRPRRAEDPAGSAGVSTIQQVCGRTREPGADGTCTNPAAVMWTHGARLSPPPGWGT